MPNVLDDTSNDDIINTQIYKNTKNTAIQKKNYI